MLITSLTLVMLVFYALITAFMLFITYSERSRSDSTHPFYLALSTMACLIWPVTLIVVGVVAFTLQRRPAGVVANKAQAAG